jgi:hypothetical protein
VTRNGTHYAGDDCPGGHQTFDHLTGTTATGYVATAFGPPAELDDERVDRILRVVVRNDRGETVLDAAGEPLYAPQDIARAAAHVLTPELLQRLLDGLHRLGTEATP